MYKRLAASGRIIFVLGYFVPVCASFAGQSVPSGHQHIQDGVSIAKSSATAEDLVYLTPKKKQEYIGALKLSAPMSQALLRHAPDFKLWSLADYPPEWIKNYPYTERSIPYAVKGDFNGDGVEDASVAGHDQTSNLILVILSSRTGYRVLTAKEDKYYPAAHKPGEDNPYTVTDALIIKEKGTRLIEGDTNAAITVLKTDAFSSKGITKYNRASRTFRQECTGVYTYEYTGKFVARYQELPAKNTAATSKMKVKPRHINKISLPDKISEALRAYNKDFVLWRLEDYPEDKITAYPYSEKSLPYLVEGDFNNDGKEDMVLAGHDKDSNITIAMMSSSPSYYALKISDFPCYRLARKHKKEIGYVPTESIESQPRSGAGFIVRQINRWELADPTDDYSDDYKLTDASGNVVSYEYNEKLFKHSGPEDECVDKGFGTPW